MGYKLFRKTHATKDAAEKHMKRLKKRGAIMKLYKQPGKGQGPVFTIYYRFPKNE